MATDADPILRNWYQYPAKGQKFRVVAIDEDAGVVEIQHFDGDLEELGLDTWYELDIEPVEAPENWSGPFDVVEVDDLGESITDTQPEDWSESLQEFKSPGQGLISEEAEETEDDWGLGRPKEEPWEGE
ncbi:hypothetical protein QVG61_04785 [Thiohalobacter sp. IOR34]|uniref:DUF6763 family protein n=1 Tax=Thiohalobacter sp. IOR34 TaxID=3057176 RepID=UPI0025AF5ED9|nr:DUF6763 family protein [Thiohalobacter sp. IOR34]WJW76415.1 hypothetical protein QVG61_04785 [Thiohalobacter sp. IOR34]